MNSLMCILCGASVCVQAAANDEISSTMIASAAIATAQSTVPPTEQGDADAKAGPNTGKLTIDFGASWTSAYFFRGYLQEDSGFIFQPYVEITAEIVAPVSKDDLGISLYAGNWNSFHSEQTGSTGTGQDSWYESDFYGGIRFTLDAFELGIGYTVYTYPNSDSFDEVQEIGITLSYDTPDDSALDAIIGDPSIGFYFEIDNSNVNAEPSAYFELGLGPSFEIFDGNATLSIPLTLGLSLDDYYNDDDFGFASIGAHIEVPIASGNYGDITLAAEIGRAHV